MGIESFMAVTESERSKIPAIPNGDDESRRVNNMVHVFVRFRVQDYAKWKQVFDDNAERRAKAGEQKWWVSHVLGDTNNLAIWLEWDNADHARSFFESQQMKDRYKMSGIVGDPEIFYLEEIARGETHAVTVR